jgi:hypothetical protein
LERFRNSLAGGFAIALLALAGAPAASAQGTITNLSPTSWCQDCGPLTLLVTVADLPPGVHIVWYNDIPAATTDVGPTQVQGSGIDPGFPGTALVMVETQSDAYDLFTPPVPFTVTGPIITSLSPAAVVVGHAGFTLTVNGTGFGSSGVFNSDLSFGANDVLNPTLIGSTQIQAFIPAAWVATPGTVDVQYASGIPGNGFTGPFPFAIVLPLQLLSTAMPGGQDGVFYDFTFQTAQGAPPLTFTATGLPATLSLNAATGEVTGTPSAGSYHISLQVTDVAQETVTGQFTLNVAPPPIPPLAFSGGSLPNGKVGVSYMADVHATGGVPPYIFSQTGGALPAGLTIIGDGAITGTPIAAGTSQFTLQVMDAAGTAVSQGFSLTIAPTALTITTGALSNAPAGTPLTIAFSATGGYPGYTFSSDAGIPGMTFSSGGTLTGTPTTPGTYKFTVTVKDTSGATASKAFSIAILPPLLAILTAALPSGQVGAAYSVQFYAANGQPPYTWTATGTPPGIAMPASGLLSGIPTADGAFTVTVTATDSTLPANGASANQAKQTYTLIVAAAPLAVTTASLPAGVAGTPYSATLAATGGDIPYTWTVQGLPSGISASPGGVLTGTPVSAGISTVSATVTDSKGVAAGARFNLTVIPAPISITTTSLPNGAVQFAYSVTLSASGGAGSNKWSATGLPAGLTMSAGGTISGTPTAPGLSVVAVTVTDAAGTVAVTTFRLAIVSGPLAIVLTPWPLGVAGVPYSVTLMATGGAGSYQWSATGLPAGFAISASGTISGTSAAPGAFPIAVTVTDAAGNQANQGFTLTFVLTPLTVATTTLPAGVAGTAYSATLAATGGAGSNKWSATGLPAGLTVSAAGTISGTPTAPGVSVVVVTVTDAAGSVAVQTLTLTVGLPPTPALNFSTLPATVNPGTQSGVQVGMGSAYPLPVAVTLTLVFTPDSGADDPAVQFSTGGRSAVVQIPAGATTLVGTAAIQTGTVAGTIVITARLLAGGQDITPSPAPQVTVRIPPSAPVIASLTAIRNSSGFTVTAIGFATPRQVTQANFQFAGAPSANLQTTSLAIPVTSLFSAWYASAAAAPFGSQFSFVQPFTVTGSAQAIASVTVTLTNAQGTSAAVTANLQ